MRYVVARARDIPDGERLIVDVSGRSVGVFNVNGRFYALLNRCPHRGGQLCKGDVIGLVESDGPGDIRVDTDRLFIACPWHGWEYDLETGESWWNPTRTRARPLALTVDRGETVADQLAAGAAQTPVPFHAEFVDRTSHRVKGPYTAEVLPVAVEDEYIVVSLAGSGVRPASD
jgi:nitrite reductase/ring-hydroxylating ferredoxin subunit